MTYPRIHNGYSTLYNKLSNNLDFYGDIALEVQGDDIDRARSPEIPCTYAYIQYRSPGNI